jgi:hypothetical protein
LVCFGGFFEVIFLHGEIHNTVFALIYFLM